MKIPLQKLKAIILYFCENTDSRFLGKVKLMKLFYFLDFIHVKKYASPVTFDRYVKLDHGPIPTTIMNLVDQLELTPDDSELSDTIEIARDQDAAIHKVVPKRKLSEAEKKYFSENEIKILEDICCRFGDKNTKFIEEASHKESPWQKAGMYQEVPYTLAVYDKDCAVEAQDIDLALKINGL